jgi:hypothetical protein
MKSIKLIFLCIPLVACSSKEPAAGSGNSGASTGMTSGSNAATGSLGSGSTTSGSVAPSGSVTTSGATSGGTGTSGSVAASGATSGVATSGAASGASAGASGGVNFDAGLPPGAVNTVPVGYAGKPFVTNVIPGFIYVANYDSGGAGVAYCHAAAGQTTPAECQAPIKLNDWCCGTMKGCDERTMPALCPVYRADDDNAGLSHMNTGEPDRYALSGPSWAAGPNGPTLTGPMVMAGTNVPQDANTTTEQDAYLSYTYTAEWLTFTVEVLAAGTYSVGGFMGVPAGTQLSLDFGNGITTGPFTPPASPIAMCQCPETYHSWNIVSNLATVTIPAAGTYLMTFTIVLGTINPLYFTFTKM